MATRTVRWMGIATAIALVEGLPLAHAAIDAAAGHREPRVEAYVVVRTAHGEDAPWCAATGELLAVADGEATGRLPAKAAEPERDDVSPSIGVPEAAPQPGGVTISWEDSEKTRTWVYYAIPEHGSHGALAWGTIATDGAFAASHEVTLSGLEPDVRYLYVIESVDADGNSAVRGGGSFIAGR